METAFRRPQLPAERIEQLETLMREMIAMGFQKYLDMRPVKKRQRGMSLLLFSRVNDKALYQQFKDEIASKHKEITRGYEERTKDNEIQESILRAMDKLDNGDYQAIENSLKVLKRLKIDDEEIITMGIGYKNDNRERKIKSTGVFQLSKKLHPRLFSRYSMREQIDNGDGAFIY